MGDENSGTRTLSDADIEAIRKGLMDADEDGFTLKAPGDDESLNQVLAEAAEQIAEHEDVKADSATLKDRLLDTIENENDGDGEDMDEDDEEDMEMSAEELANELTEKAVGMDTMVSMLAEMDEISAGEEEVADAVAMLAGDGEEMENSEHGDMDEDDDEEDMEASAEKSTDRIQRSNLGKGAGATGGDDGTTGGPDSEGGQTTNPLRNRAATLNED